jgi:competence protein ComEC
MPGNSVLVSWNHQPMVRFLVLFAAGILSPSALEHSMHLALNGVFCLCLFFGLKFQAFTYHSLLTKGSILLLVWSTGAQLKSQMNEPGMFNFHKGYYLMEVLPEPVYKQSKYRFDGKIMAIYSDETFVRANETVRVFIRAGSNQRILTGDVLLCKLDPEKPPGASLPGAFSMKDWLADNNIRYMARLDSLAWTKTGIQKSLFRRTLVNFRKAMISRLELAGLRGRELAVSGALILGDRAEIDQELVNDFTASGLVHILAVSGMHVGLLYGAWILVLGLFLKNKVGSVVIITAIPVIWLYAVITGLSASVMRATVMYSILALASLRKTPVSPYNALAGAAFILLVQDPGIYKQAGFQLSFAAVWGIISAQSIIRRCEAFRFKLIRMLAVSGLVTISAQIATAPLGFYHFGSFPVYFFLANLIAVPLSTLLTYWGIASIILAPLPIIGSFFTQWLGNGISLLNSLAHHIQLLPYARITGFYFSTSEFIMATMILLQISWMVPVASFKRLRILLICVFVFSVLTSIKDMVQSKHERYFAFRQGKQIQAVVLRRGRQAHILIGKSHKTESEEAVISALARQYQIRECKSHFNFPDLKFHLSYKKQHTNATWKTFQKIR